MLTTTHAAFDDPPALAQQASQYREDPRRLYFALAAARPQQAPLDAAQCYLEKSLREAASLATDLPASPEQLPRWIEANTKAVGQRYQHYLAQRKAGGPRQYFRNKSHALYFLKSMAPTKMVDGAWLYGLVRHWQDERFASLIRIYLEELGAGMPDKNHVVLYKKLLAAHGCANWDALSSPHFVQGAIQLSLAHHAERFLPELIGFNLGYEQLPLHLLITAYELNELGIDPYYFTLHVTVDNADTGHARTALAGLQQAWPVMGDADRFYRRVINGYQLNLLGIGTNAVIDAFDSQQELVSILTHKSTVGKQVHSDYCRVAGRTVNDWLADPAQIPAFLHSLEQSGWIKRGQAPENSRFWHLLQGDRAEMFGVFSAYELQVIRDWLTGDAAEAPIAAPLATETAPGTQRALTFKARQKLLATLAHRSDSSATPARSITENDTAEQGNDMQEQSQQLERHLQQASSRTEAMSLLAELMSPARHHTATGLKATRLFASMFAG